MRQCNVASSGQARSRTTKGEFFFPGKELSALTPVILFSGHHKGIYLASIYEHTPKR